MSDYLHPGYLVGPGIRLSESLEPLYQSTRIDPKTKEPETVDVVDCGNQGIRVEMEQLMEGIE